MKDKLSNDIIGQIQDIYKYFNHHKGYFRGQDKVLKLLDINGQMSQKQLQNELKVKSGSISELIGKVEKHGYIIKTRSNEDARSYDLKISELGKKKLTSIKRRDEEDIFDSLTESEKQELSILLSKTINNIDNHK